MNISESLPIYTPPPRERERESIYRAVEATMIDNSAIGDYLDAMQARVDRAGERLDVIGDALHRQGVM